jgi:hypothetical protein
MTGHQPEFWHPGILAKYLAADAAARQSGATVEWLVVDQARPETVEVRYPARVEGRLVAKALKLGGQPEPHLPTDAAAPCVSEGLARIIGAMSSAGSEPTLSRRVGAALVELLRPLGIAPAQTLYATELWRLDAFGELVDRMRREPERCVRTYNVAVARHPTAGMRPLIADDVQDRWELPLWRLTRAGVRRRVYAEDLAEGAIPRQELAPRALLMTGMLRMVGCSLFVHGTGGGGVGGGDDEHEGYDAVTDEWLADWLGARDLAPIAVVTATRRLPLLDQGVPTAADVARAAWRAHHARHEPAMLGELDSERRKLALVGRIAATPDRRAHAVLFAQMQSELTGYRARHERELQRLARDAAEARGRLAAAAVAMDRTWAFPLYPEAMLWELKAEIDAAFGVS